MEKQACQCGHPWPEGADLHDSKGLPKIKGEDPRAIAVRRGSYRSLFLLNSGHSCPRKAGKLSSLVRLKFQGGSGTEPEPETGTVGTVFPETESGTGTAGTVFQEPKPEPQPSFPVKNSTETQRKTFLQRNRTGTENRNRLNRSIPKP